MNFRLDYANIEKKLAKKEAKSKNPKAASTNLAGAIISISGKRVVVTGSIPGMTRFQVESFLDRFGTRMYPVVTKEIDYLILGNTRGSNTTKIQDAARLGIPVVKYANVKEFR